jgi:Tol biopolymer transport system component
MKQLTILLIMLTICFAEGKLSGPYLGQIPPTGQEAKIFAPGIISTAMNNRDIAIMPDGKEIYFCASFGNFNYNAILFVRQLDNDEWSSPEIVPFSRNMQYVNFEPFISPDGKHLYFLSDRPDRKSGETQSGDLDIWCVDRRENSWSEAYNLGSPVNSDKEEYYPTLTKEGTLYFTRQEKGSPIGFIYRSRLIDSQYQEPEKLPAQVNCGESQFNSYIAPDESFIIVPVHGHEKSLGGVDYFISFRNDKDQWSEAINLGEPVSSINGQEWSASLSPDGKYLFFMSGRTEKPTGLGDYKKFYEIFNSAANGSTNIYWIESNFLEKLRPDGF